MPVYLGKDKINNVIFTDTGTKEGQLELPIVDENGLITSSVKKQGYMTANEKFNTTLQLPQNNGGVVVPSATSDQTLTTPGQFVVSSLTLPKEETLNESNILNGIDIFGVNGQVDFDTDVELNQEDLVVQTKLINKRTGQIIKTKEYSLQSKVNTIPNGAIYSPGAENATQDKEIISQPSYVLGKAYIAKEENLIPSNIKLGTTIYGVEGILKSSIPPIENYWPEGDLSSTSFELFFEGVEAEPRYMTITCFGSSPNDGLDPNGPGPTGRTLMDYTLFSSQDNNIFGLSYSAETGVFNGNSVIGGNAASYGAFFYGFHVFSYDPNSKRLTISLRQDLTDDERAELGEFFPLVFIRSSDYKYILNYSY